MTNSATLPTQNQDFIDPNLISSQLLGPLGSGMFMLRFPFDFTSPNGSILWTVQPLVTNPNGYRVVVDDCFMETLVPFVGGAKYGVSSSNAAYATAGSLSGGATGDLLTAAGLGSTLGSSIVGTSRIFLMPLDQILLNIISGGPATAGSAAAYLRIQIIPSQ